MMIRTVCWLVGCMILLAWNARAADDPPKPEQPEPPVRLKKKEKPKPPEAAPEKKPEKPRVKAEEKDAKEDPEVGEPMPDTKETVGRIAKNMRASEERLAKKDPGEGTQQVQRDILKDLDALIEQTKRQQQQQQQQQSSSSSSKQQMERKRQMAKNQTQNKNQGKKKPEPGKEQDQANANSGGKGGKGGKDQMSKIADLYKDVWGHLPETLRQEMDQYSREQFMAKYNELLKQYYATIAEKGRRKGE